MVGTHLAGRGGVASVLRTWQEVGLMDRWHVLYVATNGMGGWARKAGWAIGAWSKCAWLIASGRARLVHVHTSSYASFWRKTPVFAMALALRRPLIISLHGGAFQDFYAARGPLGRAWIRLLLRRAARFVVLTSGWKRWVLSTEAQSRVVVIPNPAPELPFLGEHVSAPTCARAGHSRAQPLLLFLGRIEPEKGVYMLLEALADAKRRGASWQLACGGAGDIARAQCRARELGLSDNDVRFMGWIDGDVKRDWLRQCDMLALPSFTENMPVVLLEAFAYGKPVVATRVGGIPDMVSDGVDGLLCPPGDVRALAGLLVQALLDPTTLKRMGSAARKKAESEYAPSHVVAQVEAMYRELSPELAG